MPSSEGLQPRPQPRPRGDVVRDGCDAAWPVTIALLILALLVGAACAAALARRRQARRDAERLQERQRIRDELKSISVDVLTQTGASLAQRLEDQRRAEQERAAGEIGTRMSGWPRWAGSPGSCCPDQTLARPDEA